MATKTRYTMVDKGGNEIYHADSFLGFIGMTIVTVFGSAIAICILGGIVCGISFQQLIYRNYSSCLFQEKREGRKYY